MTHLTDEQFEDALAGDRSHYEHLQNCQLCASKLSEKQALSQRLQDTFSSIQASPDLVEKVRMQTGQPVRTIHIGTHIRWQYWVAAAALIVIVPLIVMLAIPSKAMAAREELVKIHNHNLNPDHTFFSESDPEKLADYFKHNLGFDLLMPEPGQGLALRGCCIKHFQGQVSGSYVVETPDGIMSIVIIPAFQESLGLEGEFERDGYVFEKDSFAKCDMVSVRIGNYAYCAVGEIDHKYLTELLIQLLSKAES